MLTEVRAPTLTPRPVASSLEELLAGATHREPFFVSDSKSGSPFERVTIDGESLIVKHVHIDDDWTMRFNGDVGNHPLQVWASGLMDVLPERIDHGVVGVAGGLGRNGWGAAILMRDMGTELVPPGDELLPPEQHEQFIDDLAALSARMWGWRDDVGLVPIDSRWTWFNHADLEVEQARGWPDPVPRIAFDGWQKFAQRAPRAVHQLIDDLRHDSSPLVAAIRDTPLTFIHGDWKLGNVGAARDGRTILIDWTYGGAAPCCYELAWYLSVNRARIPTSKEETIAAFRVALERRGIDTAEWFDLQLALALLGGITLFGWEKALGDDEELGWWCDRAREGAARL
jgi:Phosphotransferase enzyme family